MKLTTVVACILLSVAANAQTQPKTTQPKTIRVLGQIFTWRQSCDEVLGAALTMAGVQQVDSPTDGLSIHPDGSPAPASYNLTVPFDEQDTAPGQDTVVELWRGKLNAKNLKYYAAKDISASKDQEVCRMMFPMPYPPPFHQMDIKEAIAWMDKQALSEKVMQEERAWVCKVADLFSGAVCPDGWTNYPAPKRAAVPESEFQKTSMEELKRIAAEAGY